jgi:hypothetical protein
MPSFKTIALAALTLFAGVHAQYVIDPNSVDLATRSMLPFHPDTN